MEALLTGHSNPPSLMTGPRPTLLTGQPKYFGDNRRTEGPQGPPDNTQNSRLTLIPDPRHMGGGKRTRRKRMVAKAAQKKKRAGARKQRSRRKRRSYRSSSMRNRKR